MESTLAIAVLVVLAAAAALAAGYFLARRQAPAVRPLDELAGRLAQLSEDTRRAQGELTKALQERLDAIGARMGASLTEAATKTAKSIGEVETRLSVIDEAQKNILSLSGEIAGFRSLLSNKQARGAFGEVQLKDLVSSILPPQSYRFQATLSNGSRADCLLVLPNPPGAIAVDAKFPLESFHALRRAEANPERERAGKAFAAAIGKHVEDIAQRYIVPGETAESALMFLPSEAIYAELYAHHPEVVEKSYRQKVWIVSPTTLMATLNTVRAILVDVKMREQAGLIQREVQKLLEDIGRLNERVGSLSGHFHLAARDVNEIEISTAKISNRGQRIKEARLEEGEEAAEKIAPRREPPKIVKG
jgi:DNA recombination protein RmuC